MHIFDYSFLKDILLPASLVNLSANIMVLRNLSEQRQQKNQEIFRHLEKVAKVDSVRASNALEGIVTTEGRIREIVTCSSAPLNHTEAEIAGYRDVLNEIHSNWLSNDFSEDTIHLFHAQMMRYITPSVGEAYKQEDNVIAERLEDGRRVVRFTPATALETPEYMKQLLLAYMEARDDSEINQLLLIPCVILDFLCIHPFADGNGRLSRLLTLLLLYKNGFHAGKYISFEQKINQNKLDYYQSLKDSSEGWHSNNCRYLPFILNFIMTLYGCYEDLDKRFAVANSTRVTKHGRIEATLLRSLTPLSKRDVCDILPDVSPSTVEAVLAKMLKKDKIRMVGSGRTSKYIRK